MRGARIRSIEPRKYFSIKEMNWLRLNTGCRYFSVTTKLVEYDMEISAESAVTIYLCCGLVLVSMLVTPENCLPMQNKNSMKNVNTGPNTSGSPTMIHQI